MVDLQLPRLVGPQGTLDFQVFQGLIPMKTPSWPPRASTLERALARARGETPESLMKATGHQADPCAQKMITLQLYEPYGKSHV